MPTHRDSDRRRNSDWPGTDSGSPGDEAPDHITSVSVEHGYYPVAHLERFRASRRQGWFVDALFSDLGQRYGAAVGAGFPLWLEEFREDLARQPELREPLRTAIAQGIAEGTDSLAESAGERGYRHFELFASVEQAVGGAILCMAPAYPRAGDVAFYVANHWHEQTAPKGYVFAGQVRIWNRRLGSGRDQELHD